MLNKLRYKLTLICAVITASVLMFTVVSTFLITKKQLNDQSKHTLYTQLSTLVYYLQNSLSAPNQVYTIQHRWLSQLELDNDLIIHIETNHSPLIFKGSYQTQTDRDKLIQKAIDTAINQYHFNFYIYANYDQSLHCSAFELKLPTHEHYLVQVTSIAFSNSTCQIVMLKDMKADDLQVRYQLLLYLFLFLIGTILLTLFSYWFAGHALIPIIENDRRQKEFIAAASHELRSPLAVLQTNSSALAGEYPEITVSPFYHSIQTESRRMSRLISDLLLLSHADTHSHWSLNLVPTEIDTLLLEIYDLFYLQASKENYLLKLSLPEEPISPCLLDAERITQVLSILIRNAFSYTPAGTTITLALSYTSHDFCLSVIDDGPGIPDEHKKQVFERFYRIDPSRHQKEHSGLGLSIAYEIISLHGGSLTLEDTYPHGCTFKIILPIKS